MAARPEPQDMESLWLPFTSNRAFKKKPRMLSRAQGMYYWTPEGQKILDGIAGLWCCNAGHNHPKIQAAMGHSDFRTSARYIHMNQTQVYQEAANCVADRIDTALKTASGEN